MNKHELMRIKYSRIIEDPFPELTQGSDAVEFHNHMRTWFGLFQKQVDKSNWPSPWAAYRMGYEKAYAEILAALNEGEK